MFRNTRSLRRLNSGVLLGCLLGSSSVAVAQENSEQEANPLNQQVIQLYQKGRYNEAIPLAQKALAIREKVLGPEDPNTAISLNDLAELYSSGSTPSGRMGGESREPQSGSCKA